MSIYNFDEEKHEYSIDGKIIPSVTDICSPISSDRFNSIPQQILERARNRGSLVHELCEEYLLTGDIEVEELDPEVLNYIYSFVEWYKTYRPKILYTELQIFSEEFCGTLDLVAEIDNKILLIDYKTTSVIDKKSLSVQLCGYKKLCEIKNIHIDECWVLQLKQDGFVFKPIKVNEKWFDILLEHNKFMKEKYDE